VRVEIELERLRGVYKRSRSSENILETRTDFWLKRESTVEGRREARLQILQFFQVRVSLTSIILIVNHLFLIGIEFGEN